MRRFAVLAIMLLSACTPSKLAYGQVKSAMLASGLSEPNAACMASRMTDRLSLVQLNNLRKLKSKRQTLGEYVVAVRRYGDAHTIQVTATSAALCSSGFAPEKK